MGFCDYFDDIKKRVSWFDWIFQSVFFLLVPEDQSCVDGWWVTNSLRDVRLGKKIVNCVAFMDINNILDKIILSCIIHMYVHMYNTSILKG